MDGRGASILDLPQMRNNPFDLRPIEPNNAELLIGRDIVMSKWRDYMISQTPRMLLLVGEQGSGKTSLINALSSQNSSRPYIGQYWPDSDDPAHSIIHDISIHFGGFDLSPSIQQVSDNLVEMMYKEKGPLPLIAFDYPSSVDFDKTLSRLLPMLQRLRALIIVSLTPNQQSNLNPEILDLFDEPYQILNLTKKQIQNLSDRRMSRSANQKWIIRDSILSAIHENTDGNPRKVVRLLRDLVDERHESPDGGVLDRLMTWRATPRQSVTPAPQTEVEMRDDFENLETLDVFIEANEDTIEESELEDLEEDEPEDLWDDEIIDSEDQAKDEWQDDFEAPENLWNKEEEKDESEEERIHVAESESTPNTSDEIYMSTTADNAFLYMEEGTEPPKSEHLKGNFGNLLSRTVRIGDRLPTGPDDTPIDVAQPHPSLMPRKMDPQPRNSENNDSNARIDTSIRPEDDEVMSTEAALWIVDTNSKNTLPSIEPPPAPPKIDNNPIEIETEWFVDDSLPEEESIPEPIFEAPQVSIPTIPSPPPLPPTPVSIPVQIPVSLGPTWEPDNPFNPIVLQTLTEAERMILEASSTREVSPSDDELQARLEVGRSRLSQIYNDLRRKGLLSVRKHGRTRYFKLSEAANQHLRGAPEGVA
tara:strand:+ start:4258 stop:6195 length:1938 start_codon:yes stop_codon:yes gene_type:complete